MERADTLDYTKCWSNGKWFEPPMSWAGPAKSFCVGTHHGSALFFKVNVLASTFTPHRWFSRHAFGRFALDFLTFGNGYLEQRQNPLGGTLQLVPALRNTCGARRTSAAMCSLAVAGWSHMNSRSDRFFI